MKVYKTKRKKFSATNYKEAHKKANNFYKELKRKSKRRPYIKSAYFNKDKIFIEDFWIHLRQKNVHDRTRRLQYFACAVELIQNSKQEPESKQNVDRKTEILHRFAGVTKDDYLFFVQISENKKTDQKRLMSIFPLEQKKKALR